MLRWSHRHYRESSISAGPGNSSDDAIAISEVAYDAEIDALQRATKALQREFDEVVFAHFEDKANFREDQPSGICATMSQGVRR